MSASPDGSPLDENASVVSPAALKARLGAAQAELDRRFDAGEDAGVLMRERAAFFDHILAELFEGLAWPPTVAGFRPVALVAVGGYGRGELHPGSDIDLLVLLDVSVRDGDRLDPGVAECIEGFLMRLWDLGLDVGHAVRTVADCAEEAAKDVTVLTNLLESRTLAGPDALRRAMDDAIAPDRLWSSKDFFRAKLDEQRARHRRYDNTEYNLEPNVKSGPGGLRDVQMIGWIARRHFGTVEIGELVDRGLLTRREYAVLTEGRDFIWKVRWGLHTIAERGEDRLLFDHQRHLARLFGYADGDGQLAVEQFMHEYFVHVLAVREMNELVLQHFDEVIVRAGEDCEVVPLNERFRIRGGAMEVVDPAVFARTPSALLEVFVLMANHEEIDGVRAATVRAIHEHLDEINDDFRRDPVNAALFMELLRSPHKLVSQLVRMRRCGVLARYLPEFGQIVGQMQHDLFHIYTVDAHTMLLIRNLRKFRYDESKETFPVAYHCAHAVPKIELLYIAGLYHDIAKGRGGDHSELGAADVEAFGHRHGLPRGDIELLQWLVRRHLLMSSTAQRKDITDPEVIGEFAREVRTQDRLDYLYALTVADINATNPTLWNSWRATLMRQLYNETKRFLRHGVDRDVDRQDWIGETREAALTKLVDKGVSRESVLAVWAETEDDYFLKHDHNDIAWQMEAVDGWDLDTDGPLVLVRDVTGQIDDHEGATQIFVYTRDHPNLFASTVIVIDAFDLTIVDARIHTSAEHVFNTLMVLDDEGRPVGEDSSVAGDLRERLTQVLSAPGSLPDLVRRRTPRNLRQFRIPTRVEVVDEPSSPHTELRVIAADRPGLLARIGLIFMEQDISVHNAKIATLGERIDDVFFITGADGEPITDADRLETLRRRLCERIDEETGA